MKNKQLILLLLSVLIYFLYGPDYDEKIENLKYEIKYLKLKIAKEESIKEKKDEILKEIENSLKTAENNEKLIYKNKTISEIQNDVQNFLQMTAISLEAEFLGAAWEDPLIYEEYEYEEIPITTSVKSTPPIVALYLYKLFSFDKVFQIKNLEIGQTRPYSLFLDFKISSYKILKRNNQEKKKNES